MDTKGQAIFLNFFIERNSCTIGAAVIMKDDVIEVGGLLGEIPGDAATRLYFAARDAGVKCTVIHEDENQKIVSITWGDIDPVAYWDIVSQGIAVSMIKAWLQASQDAGMIGEDIDIGIADEFAD